MISTNRSYQKVSITFTVFMAVIVALVFSTMSVGAATKEFSDIKEGESGYDEVMSLVNKGIINGYEDGTFKPYKEISREHVALLLTDALHLDVPNDLSKVLSVYEDVNEDYEYAEEIAAVTEAKIFKGHHGDFLPKKSINREQMASVVAKAFQLKGNDSPVDLIDVEKASPTHQKYIKVLAQNGVTIGQSNSEGERYFDPFNRLKRVQFANLLDRTLKLPQSIDSVTDKQVTINGVKYNISADVEGIFNAENSEVLKGAKMTFESKDNKIDNVTSLELSNNGTDAKPLVFKANDNTITGDVVVNGNHVTMQDVTITGDLTIRGEGFVGDGITVEGDTVIGEAEQKATSLAAAQHTALFKNASLATLKINRSGAQVTTQGNTSLNEIVISKNATVSSEDGVVIPKVIVTGDAKEVEVNGEVKDFEINTDQTTLTGNAKIANLVVDEKSSVKINSSGDINTLEFKSGAKVTIESDAKVGNVVIPEGTKVEDVIENYEAVKEQVEQVGGQPNPDVPTPPVGGGGEGSTGPTDKEAYDKLLDDIAKADKGGTVTLARDITIKEPLEIKKEITLEGNGHSMTIETEKDEGNNTFKALYLSGDVTLNNVKVLNGEGTDDNLIEVAGNVTLKDVTVEDSKRAGIEILTNGNVTLKGNITLTNNAWGGIGMDASKSGSKLIVDDTANINYTGAKKGNGQITPIVYIEGKGISPDSFVTDENNQLGEPAYVSKGKDDNGNETNVITNKAGSNFVWYGGTPDAATDDNLSLGVSVKNIDQTRADDILTAPNGSYIGTFKFTDERKVNNLDSLSLELMHNDVVIAKNTLKQDGIKKFDSNVITTGFNVGKAERYGVSDWDHGKYESEQVPNKIKATYKLNGITYVVTKDVGGLATPDKYDANDVIAAINIEKALKLENVSTENGKFDPEKVYKGEEGYTATPIKNLTDKLVVVKIEKDDASNSVGHVVIGRNE